MISRPPTNRQAFIGTVPLSSGVLEIGPFNRPAFSGPTVRYFDVLTSDQIASEAVKLGRDPSCVPSEIHYVSSETPLGDVPERFGAVYSSHCIEHTLDAIGHVNDIAGLLHDDGCYFLVIPDKRYCFDHFKDTSSIGAVIEASEQRPKDYSLRLWIDRAIRSTHGDVRRHWQGDHGELPAGGDFVAKVAKAIEEYKSGYRYKMGPHIWCFTPDTFVEIFETCYQLGYSKLRPKAVYPTKENAVEFYAVLARA